MKKINYLLLLLVSGILFTACEKDEVNPDDQQGAYAEGIFVVNEGNFGQGNASLSFLNSDVSTVKNEIYKEVNGATLGDQAQSVAFDGDYAYIVVTGSQKIEVVDRETLEREVTIAGGLENPRYFEAIDASTALVSCWGDANDDADDYLAIINTNDNMVTGEIPVDLGPEKMIKNDDYLFIAHQGAWSTNNKVSVYDLILRQITNVIEVGNRPNSMVIKDNYLWVLCGGEPSWTGAETAGQLYKIDMNDNFNIIQTFDFDTTQHPRFLSLDGENLYYYLDGANYGSGDIYKMNVNDNALPASAFINCFAPYNMEAYKGNLYLTDAKDFVQEGEIVVFDTNDGSEKARKTVGIIPGDIGFNFE